MSCKASLINFFHKLYSFYGEQKWWPADTPFEVAIGAILTQNTNWSNVKKAIDNLKREELLNPQSLKHISIERLSEVIKPSGYYRIKAKRIKAFIDFLFDCYYGNLKIIKEQETNNIRSQLLSIHGIGQETADSILLYAFEKPVFVVDSYTKRVISRHKILNYNSSYKEFQDLFHNELKQDVQLYNEYHALFVRVGKDYCKTKPLCDGCPLSLDRK